MPDDPWRRLLRHLGPYTTTDAPDLLYSSTQALSTPGARARHGHHWSTNAEAKPTTTCKYCSKSLKRDTAFQAVRWLVHWACVEKVPRRPDTCPGVVSIILNFLTRTGVA